MCGLTGEPGGYAEGKTIHKTPEPSKEPQGPEPLPVRVLADGTPVSAEEFQRGLVAMGALLESIPRMLEPVADLVNGFGLAMRTGFAAMTPNPPPPEEPRRTSWERILEDDDYPV